MEYDPQAFIETLVKNILPFLPVLFGAVEFLKEKSGLSGKKVELLAMGIFVVYGAAVIAAFFFPEYGAHILGSVIFLLMCALAPSGYYIFGKQFRNDPNP